MWRWKYPIEFTRSGDDLILRYQPRDEGNWIPEKLTSDGEIFLRGTFHLRSDLLVEQPGEPDDENSLDERDVYGFRVATLQGDYLRFDDAVLGLNVDVLIHKSVPLTQKSFVAERKTSVLRRVAELRPNRIVIGGDEPDAIPIEAFDKLIEQLPTEYELKRYVMARVSAVARQYLEIDGDAEAAYQAYLNKRLKTPAKDFRAQFLELELRKFRYLHEKLQAILRDEAGYSENAWQEEIIQIILLLNPKYIKVVPKAKVQDVLGKMREVDMLLFDASGNIDIVELKKPFDKSIVTEGTYRDNHIPLRELGGSVMQIEKYIFYLNRWGKAGEDRLTEKYASELPDGFKVKITNPGGIIIMGRDHNLSPEQRLDFEIIRRKYRNVIDIVTYDDLLRRLDFMLRQLERETAPSS